MSLRSQLVASVRGKPEPVCFRPPVAHVSDHALRRWFERVGGWTIAGDHDGDALRLLGSAGCDLNAARMAIRAIVEPAMWVGARSVKRDGLRFVLDGRCVVSIIPIDARTCPRVAVRNIERRG